MRIFLASLLFFIPNWQVIAADFDIYQSGYRPLEVALMFDAEESAKKDQRLFYNVVKNDLQSTQSFRVLDPLAFLATPRETWIKVEYGDWRIIGAEILAMCKLRATGTGWQAVIKVHDLFRSKEIVAVEINQSTSSLRTLAHRVANKIYSAALDIPGYFTSHLLYVQKRGKYSDLVYMDHDGSNRQVVGKNFTLLLSPDWSPNGRDVVLNTYVGNRPRLEFFNLGTGKRTPFGEFDGLNSTPEFSPDGRYVAATLSYTGNTDIHIYDIKKKRWRPFTRHKGIDTSPTWSPNGKQIAFVSDRSGTPQVYRKAVSGGRVHLVSTKGGYNTSPTWSPNGDRIAMISKKNWSFAVATVRWNGSDFRYLASGKGIESPSWSPNGQMLLFSLEERGTRRVYRVPSWGGEVVPVTSSIIDASDAAWSRR